MKSFEKIIQPVACAILFLLEIYIIVLLFADLPGENSARVFWVSMAFVVTIFHLFVIMQFKASLQRRSVSAIPFAFIYIVVLLGFSTASLSYNLKVINGKAYADRYEMQKSTQAENSIENNSAAIAKYQAIIASTNDVKVVFQFRSIINDLEARNAALVEKLPKSQTTIKIDAFTLIAQKIGMDRNSFLFLFLCWVWLLAEIGLFITAPTLVKEESAPLDPTVVKEYKKFNALKNFDFEKYIKPTFSAREFIAKNKDRLIEFVDLAYRTDRTIQNLSALYRQQFINDCTTALTKITKDSVPMIVDGRFKFSKTEIIDIIRSL